jgi:hypothetical protein
MKRRRYTEQEMLKAYAEWQHSGLSKKEYCLRAGIGYSTFFNRTKSVTPGEVPDTGGFVRIDHLMGKSNEAAEVEIEYPTGVKVRLYGKVGPHFVKTLI